MKTLVFDIETDGLDPNNIWCISTVDAETSQAISYGPDKLVDGIQSLKSADKLVGHNIIGYDIPVIKKLMEVELSKHAKIVDTLQAMIPFMGEMLTTFVAGAIIKKGTKKELKELKEIFNLISTTNFLNLDSSKKELIKEKMVWCNIKYGKYLDSPN